MLGARVEYSMNMGDQASLILFGYNTGDSHYGTEVSQFASIRAWLRHI